MFLVATTIDIIVPQVRVHSDIAQICKLQFSLILANISR